MYTIQMDAKPIFIRHMRAIESNVVALEHASVSDGVGSENIGIKYSDDYDKLQLSPYRLP